MKAFTFVLFLVLTSHAEASQTIDYFHSTASAAVHNESGSDNHLPYFVDHKTQVQIRRASHVIAAWNPTVDEDDVATILANRAFNMGPRDGFAKPIIALIDASTMLNEPSVAAALLSIINEQYPLVGKELLQSLGMYYADHSQDSAIESGLSALRERNQGATSLNLKKGFHSIDRITDRRHDWNRVDPTGLGKIMFGPGSLIDDGPVGNRRTKTRSSILGLRREDFQSCFSTCAPEAGHGFAVGGQVGFFEGGIMGTVAGASVGGPAGAAAGVAIGTTAGGVAGGFVGGAIGWQRCVSRFCNDDNSSNPSPTSSPPKVDPAPAQPSPPNHSPSDNSGGSPAPSPSTPNTDNGDKPHGENCHPGDQDCGDSKVNPDADPSNGARSDTIRSSGHFRTERADPLWTNRRFAPVVLPSRPDFMGKSGVYDHRSINFKRGSK